jgi:HAD superfamily hydrolase (TIGR01484 family)
MDRVRERSGESAGPLRGIFSDVDDTLTHEGVLVPAAYSALARAKALGLRVALVTGRPAGWADVLGSTWPVDAVVAENGAVAVHRDGRRLSRHYYLGEAERRDARDRLAAIREEVARRLPQVGVTDDQWLRACDLTFDIDEHASLPAPLVTELRSLVESLGARVLTSTIHLHAFFGAYDKAKMLVRLAAALWDEDLGQTRAEYLFVGDSPNDQACFSFFPFSAGPSNVTRFRELLAPGPGFIASAPGGHGFAEIVDAVLAGKR